LAAAILKFQGKRMYKDRTIAAVIPCYNEETQIGKVIDTMPGFVDHIVIVDDCSKDSTVEVVRARMQAEPRIVLIRLEVNEGVGGAIAAGYEWSRDNNMDMAGATGSGRG
jgi:glycosyltransferase involved in cell wall biosynthesis